MVDFLFLLFKHWIINTKCPDFSNEWESWARRGWITIMPSQSSLSIAQMCYLQHVQLYSQIREELNQGLPSHYAWGQWLSLLSEEGQILLFPKICNLATEQLTERMRTWPDPNSWRCRWSQRGLIFVLGGIWSIYAQTPSKTKLVWSRSENTDNVLYLFYWKDLNLVFWFTVLAKGTRANSTVSLTSAPKLRPKPRDHCWHCFTHILKKAYKIITDARNVFYD